MKEKVFKGTLNKASFDEAMQRIGKEIVTFLADKYDVNAENDFKGIVTACVHAGAAGLSAAGMSAYQAIPLTLTILAAQYPEMECRESGHRHAPGCSHAHDDEPNYGFLGSKKNTTVH